MIQNGQTVLVGMTLRKRLKNGMLTLILIIRIQTVSAGGGWKWLKFEFGGVQCYQY